MSFRQSYMVTRLAIALALMVSLTGPNSYAHEKVDRSLIDQCDTAVQLSAKERKHLLDKMGATKVGAQVLADFVNQYGSLSKLLIQWDAVSYSQVAKPAADAARAPAGAGAEKPALGSGICVHLAKHLPEIENIADLSHELAHATRLESKVLRGEVDDVDQFVRARLAASGGEADAFGVECSVKREILGKWDAFCAPYVRNNAIDVSQVLSDLYSGELSASLTGEPYPVMLARQYRNILSKRERATRQLKYSALENKPAKQ